MGTRKRSSGSKPSFRAQLATLVDKAPEGDDWLHELKYDGYRIACFLEAGRVRLESRNGQDWTSAFPSVVQAVEALPAKSAVLDGEVAVLMPDGRTSFQALQNSRTSKPARGELVYFAFDLLQREERDLSELPIEERKAQLRDLVERAASQRVVRYAEHFIGNGPRLFEEACRAGVEGIISKRRGRPYRPGRNTSWLKVKCSKRQEFVVGGFTEPEGQRQGIGALLVGYHDEDGSLRFAGKVGTGKGFTAAFTNKIRRELEPLEQTACPFSPKPARAAVSPSPHWIRPALVVEVGFQEWTEGGGIRHSSLLGFRTDKAPKDVRRETERQAEDEPNRVQGRSAPRGPKKK